MIINQNNNSTAFCVKNNELPLQFTGLKFYCVLYEELEFGNIVSHGTSYLRPLFKTLNLATDYKMNK